MEKDKCSICMSNIEDKCYITPCNHKYHKECIDKWKERNNTCPMCRFKICEEKISDENIGLGLIRHGLDSLFRLETFINNLVLESYRHRYDRNSIYRYQRRMINFRLEPIESESNQIINLSETPETPPRTPTDIVPRIMTIPSTLSNSQMERMFFRSMYEMHRLQEDIINARNSDEMKRIISGALWNIIRNSDSDTESTEVNSIDRPFYRFSN